MRVFRWIRVLMPMQGGLRSRLRHSSLVIARERWSLRLIDRSFARLVLRPLGPLGLLNSPWTALKLQGCLGAFSGYIGQILHVYNFLLVNCTLKCALSNSLNGYLIGCKMIKLYKYKVVTDQMIWGVDYDSFLGYWGAE